MPKRKPPSPLYTAWERIASQHRPPDWTYPPQAEAEWAALWEAHVAGDRLAQTPVEEAAMLCSLGWELAAQRGDWEAALERARRCLEHPRWEESERMGHVSYILVVDDEAAPREQMGECLGNAGFSVSEAADGDEALERIAASRPDLVAKG